MRWASPIGQTNPGRQSLVLAPLVIVPSKVRASTSPSYVITLVSPIDRPSRHYQYQFN